MKEIPLGAAGQQEFLVSEQDCIDFMGVDRARVLSTPRLIALLEMTCRNLLIGFLAPGQDSVGTQVNLRHLAATPKGMRLTCRAEIVAVNGPRVDFQISAHDECEKVAEGTHQRYIVDVERFAGRVRAKAESAGVN